MVVLGEDQSKGNDTRIINGMGRNSGNLASMAKIQRYVGESPSKF